MNGIIAITDPISDNNKKDKTDDDDDDNGKGKFKISIQRLALYDEETTILLHRAYEFAQIREKEEWQLQKQRSIGGDNRITVLPSARTNTILPDANNVNGNENDNTNGNNERNNIVEVSSDDDDENGLATIVSEDENESDDNKSDDEDNEISSPTAKPSSSLKKIAKTTQLSGKQQKRLAQDINRHASNLKRIDLPVGISPKKQKENNDENTTTTTQTYFLHLFPAAALLSKNYVREPASVVHQARSLMSLSGRLSSSSSSSSIVVVLLMQSGRFAGGVFRCGRCLSHRATTRYTVRKGQGKAQSAQDSSRRPKSIGSQLRRAGEQQLNEDVRMTLNEWTDYGYFDNCGLIFLGCPKTMRSTVFSANIDTRNNSNHNNSSDYLLSKNDDRIRKIPFDVGRATYMNVKVVYTVMMGIDLREVSNLTTTMTEMVKSKNTEDMDGSIEDVTTKEIVKREYSDPMEEKRNRKGVLALELPLTKLHEAARDGNLVILLDLLKKPDTEKEDEIDQSAGYECMTPLHFAAASSSNVDPTTASALVSALLVQGHADPTIHDACGRPPYFIAGHDKIREAFRKARAVLGEDYWDWESSKVGPPLTEENLEARRIKEVEKKRRKKARQKEKKALDKAESQEAENQIQAEREAKRAVEEAKRVRDGLSEKPTGANVCDFCCKLCKGRNARQNMFRRLDYKYCSSNCVNEHKRELMAAAAMARFGGGGN